MQRRAQVAYDAQCHLAHLTGTLPGSVAKTTNLPALAASLGEGREMTESLHTVLNARNVTLPLAATGPITVFLLGLEGTVAPLSAFQSFVNSKVVDHAKEFIDKHYPQNPVVLAHAKAAAERCPELQEALTEDMNHQSQIDGEANRVRCLLHSHMVAALGNPELPTYVKHFRGDVCAEAVTCKDSVCQTSLYSDVPLFLKARGQSSNGGASRVAIYSSVSAAVQRAYFKQSGYADLTSYVSDFFDVRQVGSMLMSLSYERIRSLLASHLQVPYSELRIVFVTHNSSAASAAEASGAADSAVLCLRPGNEWLAMDTLLALTVPFVCSLAQLLDEPSPVDFQAIAKQTRSLFEGDGQGRSL